MQSLAHSRCSRKHDFPSLHLKAERGGETLQCLGLLIFCPYVTQCFLWWSWLLLGSWPPLGLTHPPCSGIFMVHPSFTSSFIHIHCIVIKCQEFSGVLGRQRWLRHCPCPYGAPVKWGEKCCCHSQHTVCARRPPSQESHARKAPTNPNEMLCSPLWPTVNLRAGSKPSLLFHHPHIKTPPLCLSWWASCLPAFSYETMWVMEINCYVPFLT